MSSVVYPHIVLRHGGKPCIAGTGFKVRVLVEEHLAAGTDADEFQRSHPELTLGRIYGALVYYHDHKDQMDREIEELNLLTDEMRAEQGRPLLVKQLCEMG